MTRQEDGSVLYAVYGTLREGWSNHGYYLKGKSEFLGELKTDPSYTMVGKGAGFPFVAQGGDTSITVEIYRVNDESVIRGVNGLEGYKYERGDSRNWYDTCDVETPWGKANMFINNSAFTGDPKRIITTGDWNNQNG